MATVGTRPRLSLRTTSGAARQSLALPSTCYRATSATVLLGCIAPTCIPTRCSSVRLPYRRSRRRAFPRRTPAMGRLALGSRAFAAVARRCERAASARVGLLVPRRAPLRRKQSSAARWPMPSARRSQIPIGGDRESHRQGARAMPRAAALSSCSFSRGWCVVNQGACPALETGLPRLQRERGRLRGGASTVVARLGGRDRLVTSPENSLPRLQRERGCSLGLRRPSRLRGACRLRRARAAAGLPMRPEGHWGRGLG